MATSYNIQRYRELKTADSFSYAVLIINFLQTNSKYK